jgi:hypothetical protein
MGFYKDRSGGADASELGRAERESVGREAKVMVI